VKECDVIHLMNNGKIIASGSYQELIENNEEFKRMAENV
jgi:ABC-type multidrug transport system fused ATPase/permease subunit